MSMTATAMPRPDFQRTDGLEQRSGWRRHCFDGGVFELMGDGLIQKSRRHAAQWLNQMACAKMHRYRATGLDFLLGLRNFSTLTQG
jgi:hypothetical protein